jgi:serine/threonine-protein kinase
MKARTPLLLSVSLYFVLFAALLVARRQLPERVATHFNAVGQADGWMSRDGHLMFFGLFGLLLPVLIVGLCYAVRFFPASMVNIPNREYWTAPERRRETYDFLFQHSLWFAPLAVAFIIGLHFSLMEANSRPTPELPMGLFIPVVAGFLIGTVAWTVALVLRFRRVV